MLSVVVLFTFSLECQQMSFTVEKLKENMIDCMQSNRNGHNDSFLEYAAAEREISDPRENLTHVCGTPNSSGGVFSPKCCSFRMCMTNYFKGGIYLSGWNLPWKAVNMKTCGSSGLADAPRTILT